MLRTQSFVRFRVPRGFPLSFQPEANCTLPTNSVIAAAAASWHNDEALADLRHGQFHLRAKKRPTCVFWQASLRPRAIGGSMS